MNKIIIAMSGGVDSSVTSKIVKDKGYNCIGGIMKLFSKDNVFLSEDNKCMSEKNIDDARAVAEKINIPFYVFEFQDEFEKIVIEDFVNTYEKGETPNPCVMCNKNLKFLKLYQKAEELGCDKIATGHYARIEFKDGRYCLKKAVDLKKDQSYVLYNLSQEQLSHTLFPLGELTKEEVRKIANENGFDNANKKESQDICFIPDGDYTSFIEKYRNKKYPVGNFIDKDGNILGTHSGIINYTIGQRKGLGVAFNKPMYVCNKNIDENTVTLCSNEELFETDVIVKDFNYVSIEKQTEPFKAMAKIRYNMTEQPCTIIPLNDTDIKITFDNPQRAITPGQSAVVYRDDYVLGGGKIQ